MESSKEESDDSRSFELHKSVFDNDLKRLLNIIKSNKDVIDKKVSENMNFYLIFVGLITNSNSLVFLH